ncbi:MAG: hypothetical protein RLZZ507_1482 [Cyanobacteriota bacterium]|jgi:hypothetical protein
MKKFCLSLLVINTFLFSVNSQLSTAISPPINTIQQLENNSDSQLDFNTNEMQIIGDEILLSENLQNQLETEILEAQKELDRLSASLSIQFNDDVGIVYFHKGRNNWEIKFTFGGLVLNQPPKMILSIKEIFALKESFNQIKWIEVKGKKYATTGLMRQMGPILHKEES